MFLGKNARYLYNLKPKNYVWIQIQRSFCCQKNYYDFCSCCNTFAHNLSSHVPSRRVVGGKHQKRF